MNKIERVNIKKTDLNVSRLCIGGCPLGEYGWGDVSHEELIKTVSYAYELGINFFDTADTYGLGKSEQNLSYALGKNINNVVISSKFGVRIENGKTFYDNSPEYIEKALNGSLKRLNREYIDIYTIHYRDKTPLDEVVNALLKFQKMGKIRYFGFSNMFEEDESIAPFAENFVTLQDEYSLAKRDNEKSLKSLCDSFSLTPLTWGSLGQGILTGKFDENCKFDSNDRRSRDIYVNFHGEKLKKNLEIVKVLREISCMTGKSIPSVAIRWILDYLDGSVAIVGVKTQKQLLGNLEALSFTLNDEQIERLNKVSLEAK